MTAVCLSGCGFNLHPTQNHNLSQTQVLLQNDEFKVVGKAVGEASTTYVFGIGGLSQKAIYNNAIANMFNGANLSGSQTIIHVNIHQHIGGVPPFYIKARYIATGTIVDFGKSNQFSSQQNNTIVQSEKTYKVGNLYIGSKGKGIVVAVSDDGKHGKIISLNQAKSIVWSTAQKNLGANNSENGKKNCEGIINLAEYPAFDWCARKGWYLPSLGEMQSLYKEIDIINTSLKKYGGDEILPFEQYWTSTEKDMKQAISVQSTYYSLMDKSSNLRVVAMAEF